MFEYTPISIPETNSTWTASDKLGALRVRFSIGRNDYRIKPGLYRLGNPNEGSDVFISANYKLSFDHLRKHLEGFDAWILVLDTKGINVWCAAGKGSFGTSELVHRIESSGLKNIIQHRRIIVPQLGAPGIAAYAVKTRTGFNVKFGPIRAMDIPAFIKNNYRCTDAMRKVNFAMTDRLILTPVELVNSLKYFLYAAFLLLAVSGIVKTGFSFSTILEEGPFVLLVLISAYISGAFLTPLFLPYIPSRYFSLKGIITGGLVSALLCLVYSSSFPVIRNLSYVLMSMGISSFLAMNFTGASTYTSLSGVRKEMKIFVPVQLTLTCLGLVILIISKFV